MWLKRRRRIPQQRSATLAPAREGVTRARWLALAANHQMLTLELAEGRCFTASALLAHELSSSGVAVDLVRWRVVGDPRFRDHWAIRLDDEHTLDLTSVQFSAHAPLVMRLQDYPENFRRPRSYPAMQLLAGIDQAAARQDGRLGFTAMAGVAVRIWRHDACRARLARNVMGIVSATSHFVETWIVLGLASLSRWAHQRRKEIESGEA